MQRGFTNNSSAVNAALIISEAQNESKDIGEPLKLVTLDACKAFDIVWQDSLLRKIYNVGIQGKLWTCLSNLYKGATSAVKLFPLCLILNKVFAREAFCLPCIINSSTMNF